MSSIIATVEAIQTHESLNLVRFRVGSETLWMMSLELDRNLQIGSKVKLSIKPSHVTLSRERLQSFSSANQVEVIIKSIKSGTLLSSVTLDLFSNTLEALITRESQERLELRVGEKVVALMSESELSIGEILDA